MRLYTRRLYLIALLAIIATLAIAPGAWSATGSKVIADCNAHNELTHHYSVAELSAALRSLPADVQEYSSCQDAIQRALLAEEGKLHTGASSGSSSSGGSTLPTPVIAIVVVLLLASATLGAIAIRRRRA